jgi:hypothetical protein
VEKKKKKRKEEIYYYQLSESNVTKKHESRHVNEKSLVKQLTQQRLKDIKRRRKIMYLSLKEKPERESRKKRESSTREFMFKTSNSSGLAF